IDNDIDFVIVFRHTNQKQNSSLVNVDLVDLVVAMKKSLDHIMHYELVSELFCL
ncbi:5234_t:CDS:1, partial [Entrophospora sp. SA101]